MRKRQKFFIIEILLLVSAAAILVTLLIASDFNQTTTKLEKSGKEMAYRVEESLITYSSVLKALGYNFLEDQSIEREKFYLLTKFYKDRYSNILYFQYFNRDGYVKLMFPELSRGTEGSKIQLLLPAASKDINLLPSESSSYLSSQTLTLDIIHPVFTKYDTFNGTLICKVDLNEIIKGISKEFSDSYNLTIEDAQGNRFAGKDVKHTSLKFEEKLVYEGTLWTITISLKEPFIIAPLMKALAIAGGFLMVVAYVGFSQYKIYQKDNQLETVNEELEASIIELTESQKRLIEVEKVAAMGRLVTTVAHEMNTPLGNCIMMNDFLMEQNQEMKKKIELGEVDQSGFADYFETLKSGSAGIVTGLNRMATIVNRFKELTVTNLKNDCSTFNLSAILEERLMQYRYEGQFKWHIEADSDLRMTGMLVAYEEIFNNLISNSLEHGFKGVFKGEPTITVSLKRKGLGLEIIYRDNGCGIREELLDKVVEPLFSTSLAGGCGGIGLNLIMNHLHYSLGGNLKLESTLGNGLTVNILIDEVDWVEEP